MKNQNTDLRVSARTYRLTAGLDDDGPPWEFNGIAVAAGDILTKDDGTRVLFTEEELRAAAETQAGEPLTKDHPDDGNGRPQYPPPTDDTIGTVEAAGWVSDAQGVGYQAVTHDEDIANGIRAGTYDVSIHSIFNEEPHDGPEADVRAVDIRFLDLSVVSKGMSPSNSAEWGANQALASITASGNLSAEISEREDGDVDESTVRRVVTSTLRAMGVQTSDEAAESAAEEQNSGADSGSSDMERDTIIDNLADEHGFDREWLEAADDGQIEQLHDSVQGSEDTENDDTENSTENTLADMTIEELADGLQERGFVTDANADELVAEAQEEISKREKVDEIIAASDDYDEDDREDLLASAGKVIDREHDRITGDAAAQLPGMGGVAASMDAPGDFDLEDDESYDEYGTGIAGH